MKADARAGLWLFRANLAIFLISSASAVLGYVYSGTLPGELALWFAAGLVSQAAHLLLWRTERRPHHIARNIVSSGVIMAVLLYQSTLHPEFSLLRAADCLAALISGTSLLAILFRKQSALPLIGIIQQLHAERAGSVAVDFPR